MLRRTAAMKFAPGAYVFPGGSVDQGDYDAEVGWQGPSPAEFGARFGAPAAVAQALVCAAVRETFEEAGVLLAGAPGGPLADPSGPSWEADRLALTAGELTLARLLSARGWCCGPTCSSPGPAGSRRKPSRAGSTRGSSPPPCRTASRPSATPPKPITSRG